MEERSVLIIEDEEDILALVHFNLIRAGYRVDCATSGEEGLKKAYDSGFDLILLDVMLPEMDGLDVCRALKQDDRTNAIPIIMLTAKGEEEDIVAGLEMGAEDYITKPFSLKVLLARVKTALRRNEGGQKETPEIVKQGDLTLCHGRREVLVRGEPVSLTETEFRVLQLLIDRPGWVFTRYQIVNAVKGEDYHVTERSVDVQVVGLRRKLTVCGDYIETVRGVGYRFKDLTP